MSQNRELVINHMIDYQVAICKKPLLKLLLLITWKNANKKKATAGSQFCL